MGKNLKGILVFLAIFSSIGMIQAQDSLVTELIKANTHDLTIENGKLSGKGADVIRERIRESQFLLVGEQHGIKEVSEFTSALFIEAVFFGYEYICIETDSYMAAKLEELAIKGEDSLINFLEVFPLSIPFYDGKEEFQLLQNVLAQSKKTDTIIWGVDQVFLTMPRYLFTILLREAHSDVAKKAVTTYIEKAKSSFDQFIETTNPQKLILLSLDHTDFNILYDAFGPNISMRAKTILSDIQKTQEIYTLWATGKYYENNNSRAQLMKKQFMEYYKQASTAEKLPKVVFKFGATHTYRGLSVYNQFDLGNMVSELAEINGKHSVHFHFSGVKGMSQGFAGPPQRFDNYSKLNPLIKRVLDERIHDESWVLIDMEPLRKALKDEDLDKIREFVFGYDFLIYVPEAHPLTRF